MELNREQIIKALERDIRISIDLNYECPRITYSKLRDALSLITSQEQRIKELTEENERLREITERTIIAARMNDAPFPEGLEIVHKFCEQRKADTVRKMQAEIEARCIKGGIYPAFVKRTIDQIAKEMSEGNNENNN